MAMIRSLVCLALATAWSAPRAAAQCDPIQLAKYYTGSLETHVNFGSAVAIDATHALVGAYGEDGLKGAAHLFDLETGQETFKLSLVDGAFGDWFGRSAVALAGDTAFVGAYGRDLVGSDSGAAYRFDVNSGALLGPLTPSDPSSGARFGCSMAVSGGRIAVGAFQAFSNGSLSGAVYIFDVESGNQLLRLAPADVQAGDSFGFSVAMRGANVLIGAPGDDEAGDGAGAVYVFDAFSGAQKHKLLAADAAPGDAFGSSVGVSSTTALVGAWEADVAAPQSGAAYLFDVTSGAQLAKLAPADGADGDRFGLAVAIFNDTVLVSSYLDDDVGDGSGSVYQYDAAGNALDKFTADDGGASDHFGWSLAIHGTTALIGAVQDADLTILAGSAYTFGVLGAPAPEVFCTSKTTSIPGCLPAVNYSGAPSLSVGSGFDVTAGPTPGSNFGLFLYSTQTSATPLSTPFGFLCIGAGTRRIAPQNAGGDFGVCNGQFSVDFAAYAASTTLDPELVPGASVELQAWYRDLPNPGGANFSEALRFTLCP